MGIAFVFAFLPLLFLGIHKVYKEERFGMPILAVSLSGIVLSHIMHLLFLLPLILIFLSWQILNSPKKLNFLKNISTAIFLGILISAFYLLPAIYYSQFTRIYKESGFFNLYERHFINFNQLIYSKWGYGPIINNAKNGENSFQLGIAQWVSVLIVILLLLTQKLSKTYRFLSISLLIAFFISIFLMLDDSKPIWRILTKHITVDYPFRLLLPSAFIASTIAGIILVSLKKIKIPLFVFLIITAVYTNRNHLNVNQYTNYPINTYLEIETEITTNTFNEYLPLQANAKLLGKPWNEVIGQNFTSRNSKQTTNILSFDLKMDKDAKISIGQFYFPGQTLYVDNQLKDFTLDKEGRISASIPQGNHTITVRYRKTIVLQVAMFLTITGLLILGKKLAFD